MLIIRYKKIRNNDKGFKIWVDLINDVSGLVMTSFLN